MDKVVVLLCTLTSTLCAFLLFRGYSERKTRLLMWSANCFALLAVSNALLFADRFLTPVNLMPLRTVVTLVALIVLLYGLVMEGC